MQGNAKHFDNRKEIITRNTFTTAIFSANEATGSSKVYWSWNRRPQKYFSRASLGLLARYFANLQRSTRSSANLFDMFILDAVHTVGEREMEDGPPGQLIMAWWAGKTNQLLVSDN